MDIYINNEKLEFTLEKETSLQDILKHIQDWAGQRELYLIDYNLDSIDENGPFHSGNIHRLDISLGDRTDLLKHNLIEMQRYVDRILKFLAEKLQKQAELSAEESAQLLEGKEWLSESLVASYGLLSGSSQLDEKVIHDLESSSSLQEHIICLSRVADLLSLWYRQFSYNILSEEEQQAFTKKFLAELPAVAKSLEEIASDFTVGKEVKGFQTLDSTLAFFSDGLLYLSNDPVWGEVIERLTDILRELVQALSDQDMVNAADIIDYDLREILDEIMHLTRSNSVD